MKKLLVLLVLLTAGVVWYARRRSAERRAKQALVASLCADELDNMALRRDAAQIRLAARGGDLPLASAEMADVRARVIASSLSAHYAALGRTGWWQSVASVQGVAEEVSAACPEAFPSGTSAELLVAYISAACEMPPEASATPRS